MQARNFRWSFHFRRHLNCQDKDSDKDFLGRQPMEYLKKYLLKGQYSTVAGSMYWLNADIMHISTNDR
ncbi:hypothetical protein ACSAZL_12130 [Methanosarcina sp. T3]|uniref:hypothetical protein n=1 Tax=Methanosarcina sp. T3 TaxID=3439062 RepID=UPI003F86D6A2